MERPDEGAQLVGLPQILRAQLAAPAARLAGLARSGSLAGGIARGSASLPRDLLPLRAPDRGRPHERLRAGARGGDQLRATRRAHASVRVPAVTRRPAATRRRRATGREAAIETRIMLLDGQLVTKFRRRCSCDCHRHQQCIRVAFLAILSAKVLECSGDTCNHS